MQQNPPVPLYYPLNTLKAIGEDIWIVDGGLINMDMKIGKLPFSTRMTIVRLENSDLWCHSPIAPDEELLAQIDALGTVRHLVSPNMIHYAYIVDWKKLYPQATAWASPKVTERAKAQRISVTFDKKLTDTASAEWVGQIEQLIFQGSRVMSEVVFFHRASRTLILADLIGRTTTRLSMANLGTSAKYAFRQIATSCAFFAYLIDISKLTVVLFFALYSNCTFYTGSFILFDMLFQGM